MLLFKFADMSIYFGILRTMIMDFVHRMLGFHSCGKTRSARRLGAILLMTKCEGHTAEN
jgi:hypothetical protein